MAPGSVSGRARLRCSVGIEYAEILAQTIVLFVDLQADILKEDQAQNTCIFSTDFALKMMGDIKSYFVENALLKLLQRLNLWLPHRRSRRGLITQLAFTLANGFPVEYYRLRHGTR